MNVAIANTLHALHVVRGKALQADVQASTFVPAAGQDIPPHGYCSSTTKQHVERWNGGWQEVPRLLLEEDELRMQRQDMTAKDADPTFQSKEVLLRVDSTCTSHKELKVSDEPPGQCTGNSFEADESHCPSKDTREDSALHYTELVESSPPLSNGVEDNAAECSPWETLSVEQTLQQWSDMHCAENYVEKCVYILQMCKRRGSLAMAARVYAHISDDGLEAHGILGSYVVAMFVHCGSLAMAQQAYNKLFHHNEYSWSHLLQGYIEGGDPEHGLYLFFKMKAAGIQPSKFAFVAVLRACTTLKCTHRGQQLHAEIVEVLQEDLYVIRALVDFYVRCGLFAEAWDIFHELQGAAKFLEKTPITGYVNHEPHEDAVDPSDDMQSKEVSESAIAYVFFLNACSSIKALTMGRELHLQAVKEGHDRDHFVGNTLISMYAKCSSLSEAWKVLNGKPDRDVVSWTALITGCVEHGLSGDALKYSEMMQREGVPANAFTLVACLKACGLLQDLESGRKLHAEIMKEGLYTDFVICNSLVYMYAKCGSLEEAHMVFDSLARQDIISWTSLIAGYTDHGSFKEAISCFEQMQVAGVSPNTLTFICCLKACAFLEDLEMGRRLHKDIVKEELETNMFVGNSLLSMYAKSGFYLEARAVFEDLPSRDDVSCAILIAELAKDGHGEQAVTLLEQMNDEGFSPSSLTYAHSLKACASLGAIEKGRKLHIEIIKRGFEGNPFVFKALIGLYADCGEPNNLDM